MRALSVCNTSLQSRVPNTFLKFVLPMRAGRSETEKCQVVILKQRFMIRCHAAFRRQGRRGTHSRRDWHLKRELGSSSHTKKAAAALTKRVCRTSLTVSRHRSVTENSEAPPKRIGCVSEQTSSLYTLSDIMQVQHKSKKNTRECRNVSAFGKTLGVHGCTLTHEVLQHEESQIRQEHPFVSFSKHVRSLSIPVTSFENEMKS